ncbi:MAG: DUF501 domain-containing protein [Bifidobacteriaceae bacterium]|jgi:hypothetical protein|nr:DUF501 domain-containing protein [Bifidobacteriaceae bacterium]
MKVFEPPTAADIKIVEKHIGRTPRGLLYVQARCVCSNPAVVSVQPLLDDGTPFPTFYWLTLASAVKAVSKLEASGLMKSLNQQLANDPIMRQKYQQAHEFYLRDRTLVKDVPELHNISAGGMPTRVKCLHALLAHSLASGYGINPIGDQVRDILRPTWSLETCYCSSSIKSVNLTL